MKKYLTSMVAVFVLLLMAQASATSQTLLTKLNVAGALEPMSVPGSINRGSGAVVKPGYTFVRRGNEVDVVRVQGRFKTGTYVCRCRSGDANQRCELFHSPKQIACQQGSCSGVRCVLTPIEPASSQ